MLKKLMAWLVMIGLSLLVSNVLGWTEQGKAFMYIYIGYIAIAAIAVILGLSFVGMITKSFFVTTGASIFTVLFYATAVAIKLLIAFVVCKIFKVDFYVTFEILAFIYCLIPEGKKKTKNYNEF